MEAVDILRTKPNLQLTRRDYDLINFLLEMKFASLDELYNQFFKVNFDGTASKSNWWARERITQLKKYKLVEAVRSFYEPTTYYVATNKGYNVVCQRYSDKIIATPLGAIDLKNFEHDRTLLKLRQLLEGQQKVTNWQSERSLFQNDKMKMLLTKEFRPDAIYTNPDNQKVAFEYELTLKSKIRYFNKIKKYVAIIRNQHAVGKIFESVHYVCAKDCVYETLVNETKMYGNFFKVEKLSDYNLVGNSGGEHV